MTIRTKADLKALFERGDIPRAQDFGDLIDSLLSSNGEDWPTVLPASSAKNLTDIASQVFITEWLNTSSAVGYVDPDTMVLTGNVIADFLPGRRVRALLGTGYVYSDVATRTYDGGSNVTTVNLADAVLDSSIQDADYGVFTPIAYGGAAGLGVLGVSAFAASLLDDVDAAAAQSTLGISAFIRTLLDDADAATARATLGAAPSVALFPSGTRLIFQQSAAPTGWTKDTGAAYNDVALRLVTGSVGTGGTNAFSTVMAQTTVGNHTLGISEIPSHTHSDPPPSSTGPGPVGVLSPGASYSNSAGTTGSAGGGGAHNHPITLSMKYADVIVASKD